MIHNWFYSQGMRSWGERGIRMSFLKKNLVYYMHIAVFLIITFGFGFIPPFAQITELGMRVLGVFIGVIYAWCFIALDWPSMVALCALGMVGFSDAGSLFQSGWSFQVLPQIVLCFLLAEGVAQTKLTDYIANKMLSIRLFIGRPYILIMGILVAQLLMNLLGCAYAGLFLLWGLAANVAQKAGYEKRNMFTTVVVTSTVAIYVWSASIFPFNPMTLMQIGFLQQAMTGIEVPFFGWIVLWTLFTFVYCALWPLFVKFVLRPDFSAVAAIDFKTFITEQGTIRMNQKQKFGLSVLIGFIVAMFIPKVLPETWIIAKVFSNLGLSGCLAIAVCIMVAWRDEDGKHYLTLQRAANAIQWNVVWLLVATEPLSTAFNSAECGIMASIMAVVTPLLTTITPGMFLIICVVVLGVVTQVVHNMVLMVVFIPILCPLYLSMDGNPWVMFVGLVVALNAAFATPAASWSSAMMFGVDTTITKQMYLHGMLHFIFSLIMFFVVAAPLVNVLLPY